MELIGAWVDIQLYEYCQICGQAVKPKGKGSHKCKHPGQMVSYSWLHPDAIGVSLYLLQYKEIGSER